MGRVPPRGLGNRTTRASKHCAGHLPSRSTWTNMSMKASSPASDKSSSVRGSQSSMPSPVLTGKLRNTAFKATSGGLGNGF